jgi:hypothetical protein
MAAPTNTASLVGLVAGGTLDAELGALVWLLVEHEVPLVVAAPAGRLGAGEELARAILASVRPDAPSGGAEDGARMPEGELDRATAWALVHGHRASLVVETPSLEALRDRLLSPPVRLSAEELTFLGLVLVLAPASDRPVGPLRVAAAHYVRPLARDAHGHAQLLGPAVLATWDAKAGRYEHFAWGVLPEIAARFGLRAGDLEADLHHRRDDLGGLATAGVTALPEVQRLVAGYRAGYGNGHGHGSGGD